MIILGLLIVAGVTIIGITITTRLKDVSQNDIAVDMPDVIQAYAPKGSQILAVDIDDGFLFVSLAAPEGDIVIIIELKSGKVLRRLNILDEP